MLLLCPASTTRTRNDVLLPMERPRFVLQGHGRSGIEFPHFSNCRFGDDDAGLVYEYVTVTFTNVSIG